MANKKNKTKSLLPKRIAGVKVPKAARKGRFGELLASRTGQALIAEAVLTAGPVDAAGKAGDDPKVSELADRLQQLGGDAGKAAGEAGTTLAFALGEAARSFVSALNQRDAAHAAAADNDSDRPEARPSKKKPASYETDPL